jgi:hypothetical protein
MKRVTFNVTERVYMKTSKQLNYFAKFVVCSTYLYVSTESYKFSWSEVTYCVKYALVMRTHTLQEQRQKMDLQVTKREETL